MSAAELLARGDPVVHNGLPGTLEVLAWIVGGFWALVGAILLALWYARQRRAARPEAEARAEHDHREHVAFVERLRPVGQGTSPAIMRGERGRVVLYPELSGIARTSGRHRDVGKRRLS